MLDFFTVPNLCWIKLNSSNILRREITIARQLLFCTQCRICMSVAWHNRLKNQSVILKLRQLNRLAMLLLTKRVYRSTPTKSMELLLNYPPLHLLLEEEASKAFVRVQGKIKLKWEGIGQGTKRGSLLVLQNESKVIIDSLPFLGDQSKRLNYFKPYTISSDLRTRIWLIDAILSNINATGRLYGPLSVKKSKLAIKLWNTPKQILFHYNSLPWKS